MTLVLKLDLVGELVCDSCLEEREVAKLVPVGINPSFEELVGGVDVVLFK